MKMYERNENVSATKWLENTDLECDINLLETEIL